MAKKTTKAKAEKVAKVKKEAKASAVTTRPPLEEKNGIKRPREGGVCAAVWSALDGFAAKGEPPSSKDVRELVEKHKWNQNNASIEFSRWRKFNGIAPSANKPA
jgi:hypothetical protein